MGMEQLGDYDRGSSPPTHQYPDPDVAAYITKYPWVGEDDGYVPSSLRNWPQNPWRGDIQHDDHGLGPGATTDMNGQDFDDDSHLYVRETSFDPDYEVSDVSITDDDDNISDEESMDSADANGEPSYYQTTGQHSSLGSRERITNPLQRRGRLRGQRGGGKGIKKGLRKPIEPTIEFKQLHSQATIAFVEHRYEDAERLTLQALLVNPEMYEAHNLLSEIHAARGDKDKALSAAWNGAHTRPRDPEMWSRIARLILERDTADKVSSIRDAIYCYNRVINVDTTNVEARYQRAALNHELGYKRKAANEYEYLRKQLPHDTTVLRHLAEVSIEIEEPDRALRHYNDTIAHFQSIEPDVATSFTWSDVNIVTELYGFQQRYDEGLVELKNLGRWLLGRRRDTYWQNFNQDDREWDLDDEPRRIQVPQYVPGEHDASSYGDGLPLELRIKLGIFRLRSESRNMEEAINHFEWLDPGDAQIGAKLYDYPDLYREAANALRGLSYYHEALHYYEPLQQVSEYTDATYFLEMAACYRATGLRAEAVECYQTVIELDGRNMQARKELAELNRESGLAQQGLPDDELVPVKEHKRRRRSGDKSSSKPPRVPSPKSFALLAPRPVLPSAKQLALEKEQTREEDVHALFRRRNNLTGKSGKGNDSSKAELMAVTKILIESFRANKVFYPLDRHRRFYGYSVKARNMAARTKHELDALAENSISFLALEDGELIKVPEDYCGIPFHNWLDIFLEYGMALAQGGDPQSAYEVVAAAYHANVFAHSPDSLLLIHVCWFTCALIANDGETLCNVARWFMREYQFVTDGYRFFSALNRLCDSENSWFNCGPSQKYILRQLKAVDFSLIGEATSKNLFQGRASYTTKDSNGNPIRADDMDVALLMLYGHVLYAGKSYANAVNYFLRALALDPSNGTIKLSLALGYLHHALKRQAENRHHILMQGLSFLLEYYDSRQRSSSLSEKQEAEFNVGHAYHILGLTHLAIPYFERCLDLSTALKAADISCGGGCGGEDFGREAAIALQGFWAMSGNLERARRVTEQWLVV